MCLLSSGCVELSTEPSAHGNAGEASIFLVLADRKLKLGGVLALVMPLSLISGDAWKESRTLLAKEYSNLVIISIVGATGTDVSFSADTSIGECLIIGRKCETRSTRATFLILNKRPEFPLLGLIAAEQICREIESKNLRRLEDGPVNGTPLRVGGEVIGHALDAPLPVSGGWNVSRIADLSLAQTAYQLTKKKCIWLPAMTKSETVDIPLTTVAKIGELVLIIWTSTVIHRQEGSEGHSIFLQLRPIVCQLTPCFGLMMQNVSEPCHLRKIVRVFRDKDRAQGNKLQWILK